ncbi:hypothetical protein FQA39_LY18580 [Lamprigera yunnana]|nr:hypothetical protein FQA39_LY18580 [Lamprigera yunnana]
MPLIVITGLPSSGKTTRTNEIKNYFEKQGKEVHVVSEEEQILKAGFEKDAFYLDSSKEKHIRALLKSEVVKLLGPNFLVTDMNCIVLQREINALNAPYTGINTNIAWNYSEAREEQYEEPIEKNRWDSPLFMVFPEQILDMKPIYECLFEKKPPPPNQSTQNLPNDMENYMKYHLMGLVSQVRIKPGCIPTKFACQPGRKTGTSVERQYIRKKRKMMAIEECEKQLEESNRVIEHFDFEDIASGSSGKDASASSFLDSCTFLKTVDGVVQLNTKHMQVQLGMTIFNLPECDFVMYSSFDNSYMNLSINQLKSIEIKQTDVLKTEPDVKIFLSFKRFNSQEKYYIPVINDTLSGLLDNITFLSPPSPLLSRYAYLDPKHFCNGDQNIISCRTCQCTHVVKIPVSAVVELILVDEVHIDSIHHPFHLHGFSYHVLGLAKMPVPGKNITLQEAVMIDRLNLLRRNFQKPSFKLTVMIPSNGYVVLRFKADKRLFLVLPL